MALHEDGADTADIADARHESAFHTDPNVRRVVTSAPEQLLSPPYEMRDEFSWIDFSGTSNPLGMPASFSPAMQKAIASGAASYPPDKECHALRSILARRFALPVEAFLCGTTVCDMIRAVAQTYQPCTVGISTPGPAAYALIMANAGHQIVDIVSPSGFVVPDPAVARTYGTSFDAAMLANPTYPTSRLLPKTTLRHYLNECKWVIVDERSIELTLGGESMVPLTSRYRNLIVVRSFIDSFALLGAPISYCVAHPDTIAQIEQFYDSSGISMFAEVLSDLFLEEDGHLEHAREHLDTEIPWLQFMLSLIPGISIFPAEANYVMCTYTCKSGMDLGVPNTAELARTLQLNGFLIRTLEDIPGLDSDDYFCVAVRKREENEKLVSAMRRIITGIAS